MTEAALNEASESMKSRDGQNEQFDEISASATQSIEESKQIAYNPRPYQLDKLGLATSIEAMTERIGASSDIAFTVDVPPMKGVVAKDQEINVFASSRNRSTTLSSTLAPRTPRLTSHTTEPIW